jgi:hypothetical protein
LLLFALQESGPGVGGRKQRPRREPLPGGAEGSCGRVEAQSPGGQDRGDGLKCKSVELLYRGLISLFARGVNKNNSDGRMNVPSHCNFIGTDKTQILPWTYINYFSQI